MLKKIIEEMLLEVSKEFFIWLMDNMSPEEFAILRDWAFREGRKNGETEALCVFNAIKKISEKEKKDVVTIVREIVAEGAKRVVPSDFVYSWNNQSRVFN